MFLAMNHSQFFFAGKRDLSTTRQLFCFKLMNDAAQNKDYLHLALLLHN